MSLVNDALRRASQAQREQARPAPSSPAPAGPPPLEPVAPPPMSPWPSLLTLVVVVLVAATVAGLGGWLLWKAWDKRRTHLVVTAQPPLRSPLAPPAVGSPPSAPSMPASVTVTAAPPALAVAMTSPAPPTNAIAVPATNALAARPPVPVKWPSLKLQGIIFKPPNSSVVINNKMLFIEDEIQGVKVADIGLHSVKICLDGETNTLVLR
jgi:hypothetical protein